MQHMDLKLKSITTFSLLCISILVCVQSCKNTGTQETDPRQPNVLFISVDDLNDWIEPLGGSKFAKTPHLNALSENAFNFRHAYCASPGCGPSRAALMTGLHTYTTGMYSNYQDWRKIEGMKERTLNGLFKENDYYTAGAGKIYHYTQTDTAGWVDYFPSKTKPMPDDDLPKVRPLNMPDYQYK